MLYLGQNADSPLYGGGSQNKFPSPALRLCWMIWNAIICENSDFIAQAQYLIHQRGVGELRIDHVDWNFTLKNNKWRDSEQRQDNHFSSEYSSLPSKLLSMGSQIGTSSQTCNLKPHLSSLSFTSTSLSSFNGFHNPSHETPTNNSTANKFTNQQEVLTKAQILLPPKNDGLHSNFKCPTNSFTAYFKSNTRPKEIGSFSYVEHKPFPRLAMPGFFNMIPTSLSTTLLHGMVGPQGMLDRSGMSSNKSLHSLDCAGKLQDIQHCYSPPASVCGLYASKSSSKASPFSLKFPENFFTSHQELSPQNSPLVRCTNEPETQHIHDISLNNHIHSSQQTDDQVNNSLASSMTAEFPNSLSEESPGVCASTQLVLDNDLFDGMELNFSPMILMQEYWDDVVLPISSNNCTSELEFGSVTGAEKEFFSDSGLEQLLDAVAGGNSNVSSRCNSVRTKSNVSASQDSRHQLPTKVSHAQADHLPVCDLSSLIQTPAATLSEWNAETMIPDSPKTVQPQPNVCTWIDDSCSVNAESSAYNQPMKTEETVKVVRKRSRPGENTRPRPKDRQQIQDRVKELREIVPNGAKCSIDALLDRTIKHLLFLRSVTRYADKLKEVDEQKIIGEDSGVVLKDNTNGGVAGATWAYEVAGQTMVCPILIEDLHPTGQMLVEMLCEERGFFLEIADIVRGFGLTILKGEMENRGRKVWARFIVEANRDVTRMDIFLSLVQFLQQTTSRIQPYEPLARAIETPFATFQQCTAAIPTGLADGRQ